MLAITVSRTSYGGKVCASDFVSYCIAVSGFPISVSQNPVSTAPGSFIVVSLNSAIFHFKKNAYTCESFFFVLKKRILFLARKISGTLMLNLGFNFLLQSEYGC